MTIFESLFCRKWEEKSSGNQNVFTYSYLNTIKYFIVYVLFSEY